MAEVGAAVEVGRMDQRVKPIIRRNQTKKVPIHIKKKVMAKINGNPTKIIIF